MGNFKRFMESVVNNDIIENARKDALTENIKTDKGEIIIDTCFCYDTQAWETGIQKYDDAWIIVEEYNSKKDAIQKHKDWVTKIKTNPDIDLKECCTPEEWAAG